MLKFLAVAALLLGAPAAYSQTVSSCPTATPGTAWSKGAWLPCSTAVDYIAEPVPATAPVSDMRCTATGCVLSWQLGSKVLPTDQVWVETTAKPTGTWFSAKNVEFASAPPIYNVGNCTTLIYQGAPMTSVSGTGAPALSSITPVIGVITLSQALAGDLVNAPVTAVSFDFSMTINLLVYPGGGNGGASASFTTDDGGNIIGWNFGIGASGSVYSLYTAGSTQNGDTITTQDTEAPSNPVNWVATNTTPGKWECVGDLLAQERAAQAQINALNAEIAKLQAAK